MGCSMMYPHMHTHNTYDNTDYYYLHIIWHIQIYCPQHLHWARGSYFRYEVTVPKTEYRQRLHGWLFGQQFPQDQSHKTHVPSLSFLKVLRFYDLDRFRMTGSCAWTIRGSSCGIFSSFRSILGTASRSPDRPFRKFGSFLRTTQEMAEAQGRSEEMEERFALRGQKA